ncbi:hypothetical protein D9758_013518 [Tetrapyrgos nigripes]|uniref:Chromo domain-containing protein n=1 Tax=Tetrapyrgos nigripes TaxID=182062 RepID=A0A8H5D1F5_9AGAR|nr:hypothetical protein D9758_013518 [Tetrapyrgos nigripes]
MTAFITVAVLFAKFGCHTSQEDDEEDFSKDNHSDSYEDHTVSEDESANQLVYNIDKIFIHQQVAGESEKVLEYYVHWSDGSHGWVPQKDITTDEELYWIYWERQSGLYTASLDNTINMDDMETDSDPTIIHKAILIFQRGAAARNVSASLPKWSALIATMDCVEQHICDNSVSEQTASAVSLSWSILDGIEAKTHQSDAMLAVQHQMVMLMHWHLYHCLNYAYTAHDTSSWVHSLLRKIISLFDITHDFWSDAYITGIPKQSFHYEHKCLYPGDDAHSLQLNIAHKIVFTWFWSSASQFHNGQMSLLKVLVSNLDPFSRTLLLLELLFECINNLDTSHQITTDPDGLTRARLTTRSGIFSALLFRGVLFGSDVMHASPHSCYFTGLSDWQGFAVGCAHSPSFLCNPNPYGSCANRSL